jgi:hypothetical protein
MQIANSRLASEGVSPISWPFVIDGRDRSYSVVASDIYASRPNCSVALSLIYHKTAMTINRYVEAEHRTVRGALYLTPVSVYGQCNISRKS